MKSKQKPEPSARVRGLTQPHEWLQKQLANSQAMTTRKNISDSVRAYHVKRAEALALQLLPYQVGKKSPVDNQGATVQPTFIKLE